MASINQASEAPATNETVSLANDVLAARIVPLVIFCAFALIGILTTTGAFSDFRDAIQNSPSNDDAGFYEAVYERDPAMWDECFDGPLSAFMPGAIDTSKATIVKPAQTASPESSGDSTSGESASENTEEDAA